MRFAIILFTCSAIILPALSLKRSWYNGKPCCDTQDQIGKSFRNFFDPTRYWYCQDLNSVIVKRCPDEEGFMTSKGKCVPFYYWIWEEEKNPPGCPEKTCCKSMLEIPLHDNEVI